MSSPERNTLLDVPMSFRARTRILLAVGATAMTGPALLAGSAQAAVTGATKKKTTITVAADETLTVTSTTTCDKLVIEEGGQIVTEEGSLISLVVDGVETGSEMTSLLDDDAGITQTIAAGTYSGDVVIAVADETILVYNSTDFPIRPAVYVEDGAVVAASSFLDAVVDGKMKGDTATGVRIASTGESFNGLLVASGDYTLADSRISFDGNGRCDFIGQGAAVLGRGEDTNLVLDGVRVTTHGVVRTAVIADDGATVVVKDSVLKATDGVLPEEYTPTSDTLFMIVVPWMLGLSGNVRTTNLLGTETKATYLNSTIMSQKWGALSVDGGSNCILTAINCTIKNTGGEGYGSYAIGNVTEHLLGNHYDVGDYVLINWGGNAVHYGDSSRAAVKELNSDNSLGLSAADIRSVSGRRSILKSGRFGVMWQSTGPVTIDGGTQLVTGHTTFLSKAAASSVTVDGSEGAKIAPGNGVIFQLIDNDNPGKTTVSGKPWSNETTAVYTEPTGDVTKSSSFDVTAVNSADATATFSDISLTGDFYNSIRGGTSSLAGKNLVLSFTDTTVKAVISASTAVHEISTITPDDYKQLGMLTDTPAEVINNGVLVSLAGKSTWTVTGTSYISSLELSAKSSVKAPKGKSVTMTVDGEETSITAGGSWTGAITLTVS